MRNILFSILLLVVATSYLQGQNFKDPTSYLNFIKQSQKEIFPELLLFAEEVENGTTAKALEIHRRGIVQKVKAFSLTVSKMPDYKSDKSIRDSLFYYVKRAQCVFESEYRRVTRLQDSASRSYLALNKVIKVKQATLNKLIENERDFYESIKSFSSHYSVSLPKKSNEEFEKLQSIDKAGKKHDVFYTMYFKCSSQESVLAKAIEFRRKTEIEQYSSSLLKFVKEGFAVLDTVKEISEIKGLMESTKSLLDFYLHECEFKVPLLLTFMARGGEDKKKGKVDIGNNVKVNPNVNIEDQESVATYANTKGDLDTERPILLGNWNKSSQTFLKKQMPTL